MFRVPLVKNPKKLRLSCNNRTGTDLARVKKRGKITSSSLNCIAELDRSGAGLATGKEGKMQAKRLILAVFGVGLMLGGCMQTTVEPGLIGEPTGGNRRGITKMARSA